MNLSNISRRLLAAIAVSAACAGLTANAQSPAGPPGNMNTVMARLLRNFAFTARAEVRILDQSKKETTAVPMNYAMEDGKTRYEVDLSQFKGSDRPAAAAAFMKQKGIDRLIVINRPDTKINLTICPSIHAYSETPMGLEDEADAAKNYKIDKTKLGKEIMDGHPCDKTKVTLTDEKGKTQTATVWFATDLKDFPLQFQISDEDATTSLRFKDVKLAHIDAKQFEPPAGMSKYEPSQMVKRLTGQQ
jgi:hypothetical protein